MIGFRLPVRVLGLPRARRTSASVRPETRAFTLIELLIVVAILALLVTILGPSLSSAMKRANDVKCKTNLKRLSESFRARVQAQGMPSPWAWLGVAEAAGAIEVTSCPLGGFEDGGTNGQTQTSGAVVSVSAPPSVVFNAFESNSNIHMFTEQTNYPLPKSITVDITEPGTYGPGGAGYSTTSDTLPAGTPVDCYFVFFDPVGNTSAEATGSITVGGRILGIICTKGPLDNSDGPLGKEGTQYDTGRNARQFESNAEKVTLSEDRRTLTIDRFHATYPGENMRILTEPGSGGSGSYAMSAEIEPKAPATNQILLIDYDTSVVYPRNPQHEEIMENMLDAERFHLGKHLNAAMVGGSVTSFTFEELLPDSRHWYPRTDETAPR